MLRKILLSSILILAIGCGGNSKAIKNGVYEGVASYYPCKLIINNNKVEFITLDSNSTNYYSKVRDKNENDKDIVYYITINGVKGYLGLKQTNDNSLVVYGIATDSHLNFMLSYSRGFINEEK